MPDRSCEVEADLHVDAAVAEVAVERRSVVVVVQQRAQVAQVGAELLRRDRRVVPAFPRGGAPGAVAAARGPDSRILQIARASAL